MLNVLLTIGIIILVVFFLGLCIFIHELAHLLVAKWRGLYVEKFSVGFGRKIWGFWYKNIEFVVSWLPFGGYVALPQ
ncbi:MAG: site-2 protease family protein, partial [Lentisphaeria bacterium]